MNQAKLLLLLLIFIFINTQCFSQEYKTLLLLKEFERICNDITNPDPSISPQNLNSFESQFLNLFAPKSREKNIEIVSFYGFKVGVIKNEKHLHRKVYSLNAFATNIRLNYKGSYLLFDLPRRITEKNSVSYRESSEEGNTNNTFDLRIHVNLYFEDLFNEEDIIKLDKNSRNVHLTFDLIRTEDNDFGYYIISIINNSLNDPDYDQDTHLIHSESTQVKDLCPQVYGSVKGCPDHDKDGFHDGFSKDNTLPEDECLNEYGTVNGCPDKDGDGVPDKDDNCPNIAGWSESHRDSIWHGLIVGDSIQSVNGCPDIDGDGVDDLDDKCPFIAGANYTQGCPDDDLDGVINEYDYCPSTYGTSPKGCKEFFEINDKSTFIFGNDNTVSSLKVVGDKLYAGTMLGKFNLFTILNDKIIPTKIKKDGRVKGIIYHFEEGTIDNTIEIYSSEGEKFYLTTISNPTDLSINIDQKNKKIEEQNFNKEIQNTFSPVDVQVINKGFIISTASHIDTFYCRQNIELNKITIDVNKKTLAFIDENDINIYTYHKRSYDLKHQWIKLDLLVSSFDDKTLIKPSTLTFDLGGQKLFIGTNNGNILVYDRKTQF